MKEHCMGPFDCYPGGGYELENPSPAGGGQACEGGVEAVLHCCGWECAYCGMDLRNRYETWLMVTVDHVVPRSATCAGIQLAWLDNLANQVTCCSACKSFVSRIQVREPVPRTLEAFFELRDQLFERKTVYALRRHAVARARWRAHVIG